MLIDKGGSPPLSLVGSIHKQLLLGCVRNLAVMWDVLLYMYYSYWLMNNTTLAYGVAEYSQTGTDT